MTKDIRYYLDKAELSGMDLIKLAFDYGWRGEASPGVRDSVICDITNMNIKNSIDYLLSKGISIKSSITVEFKESKVTPPEVRKIEPVQQKLQLVAPIPVDNSKMKIYYNDGVYLLDINLVDDIECWEVQVFGSSICPKCSDKDKETCFGKAALSGKNYLGNELPIAVRLGDRPSRKGDPEYA